MRIDVTNRNLGGCVAFTALGAIENGYREIVNTNAVGTMFDKKKDKYFDQLRTKGADFV